MSATGTLVLEIADICRVMEEDPVEYSGKLPQTDDGQLTIDRTMRF